MVCDRNTDREDDDEGSAVVGWNTTGDFESVGFETVDCETVDCETVDCESADRESVDRESVERGKDDEYTVLRKGSVWNIGAGASGTTKEQEGRPS